MRFPEYEDIQELTRNDRYSLNRARRKDHQANLLLKIPLRNPPAAAELDALEREFAILRRFSIAGIPEAIEVRRDGGLVMADKGGVPLPSLIVQQRLSLESFFEIAIQLCTTLAEVHRHHIVHHRINPRSLLVHPKTYATQIVDFSGAAPAAGEAQSLVPPPLLPEMLAYVSPEQTGRMNRAIDYRTDFYSLGVTFYEILTGVCPFRSYDVLELIHWHIARAPVPPAEVNTELPEALSQIVMKLLAKTAEQRYQSAHGLRDDLVHCATEWAAHRHVEVFALGRHDIWDRFLISQKLYGRDPEVDAMLNAFESACAGATAMMLVAGYSGIGKTALIQELYKPIVRERGYFISGKFDQITRLPYGAFIQAFRSLCRQLLTEGEEQMASWRARLTAALGANGGVIAEVIPEIELITGAQPAPPPLAPTEAQNRFRLVFQNFVGALARREHPLVIFLDDLQWADSATLGLLQPLLTSRDIRHLFLIGAYRDNEVDAAHPLARTLASLDEEGPRLLRVALGPLGLDELALLIRDTLHGELSEVEPLARLVLQKTGGNPFFVIQFLKALYQARLIEFDYDQRRWVCHIEAIARAGMTDNVIDLMTRRIQRLSEKAQAALMLGACIGNQFDLQTLAIVSRQSGEAAAADLDEALDSGLILSTGSAYEARLGETSGLPAPVFAFLHDRVQQAAYALIPDERKQFVHLSVGRLLLEKSASEAIEDKGFDIINHLNLGSGLITDDQERLGLSQLNLNAGRRAKSSTAYEAALSYFNAGIALGDERRWHSDYDLTFALHLEAAECSYLCGHFDAAERIIDLLLEKARTRIDKARVYSLRVVQYENMTRYAEAMRSGKAGLALFGVCFPDSREQKEAAVEAELAQIQSLRGDRAIASLIDLPLMTDPEMRALMHLLANLHTPCYLSGDKPLTLLNTATMVRLSLAHGNLEESAHAYVLHAMHIGPIRGDYQSAYEFGLLAMRLNERLHDAGVRARILMNFGWAVAVWREPFANTFVYLREAFRLGNETGLFADASYALFDECYHTLLAGRDLEASRQICATSIAYMKRVKMHRFVDAQQVIMQWGLALQGLTETPLSLADANFDEQWYRQTYRGDSLFEMFFFVGKMAIAYSAGENQQACEWAKQAERVIEDYTGTMWDALKVFYHALALAAMHAEFSAEEKQHTERQLESYNARLQWWAENCADNFEHQHLLVSAEMARIRNQPVAAIAFYEAAIDRAGQSVCPRDRALANELYAKFWLMKGQRHAAVAFMVQAREAYDEWGAAAKVSGLEQKYAELFRRQESSGWRTRQEVTAVSTSSTESLDVVSAMKAAQAIAGESELEKLLGRLLRIAIENAGAERGSLIFEHDGEAFIQVEGQVEGSLETVEVKLSEAVPLAQARHLSQRVVNYVRRTSESVVLAEARSDDRYANDAYILGERPRSIMCVPMLNQGRLIGAFYLENNLVSDAFTAERMRVVQLVASEAAISIENTRLYDEMKQEVTRRRKAEETLRAIVEGTAAVTGGDFFSALVRHLASAIGVRYAFATECTDQSRSRVRTLAFWSGEVFAENIEYDLALTPCEQVIAGQVCHHVSGLQERFPHDTGLVTLEAESFIGLPMWNALGEIIGHLAVLDDKPMANASRAMSVMKIFAARAAAELQRLKAEQELRQALTEVEQLKNRLHDENVYLQEEIRREHHFEEIVGSSPPLLDLLSQLEIVAPTDSTVLIHGETGTGKELIARAVHDRSLRKGRPLVKVNCGAISAGLVESELFGHVKGAFTGAIERRVGRFELADGGTLFLDEVSELPLDMQVKLLRVLQEWEFEPVGSSRTVRVDVRIIAATNRRLEEAIQSGRFRQDLFYRLNVFPLSVPPLRERLTDIPQLVMFFMSRFAKRFGKKIDSVAQESMELLKSYAWPGNVRELQNIIERAVVLCQGQVLTLGRNLFPAMEFGERPAIMKSRAASASPMPTAPPLSKPVASQPPSTLEEVERRHILDVLEQTRWTIDGPNGAARLLNRHPNTLRSRMKKLGIQRPRHDIS